MREKRQNRGERRRGGEERRGQRGCERKNTCRGRGLAESVWGENEDVDVKIGGKKVFCVVCSGFHLFTGKLSCDTRYDELAGS